MKLLVFAHKPPPYHGQSYMVELLLDALNDRSKSPTPAGNAAIECFHLDARYSTSLDDMGEAGLRKVWLALRYALQAIAVRVRDGVGNLYYIPPFPARAPIYRDLLVLGLCRLFFKRVIYHWHAVGLGDWLETEARPWERWLCRKILGCPDLSIVLRPFNRTDAVSLTSRRIVVVPNGLPDPCPDFESGVLPRRNARVHARRALLSAGNQVPAEQEQAGGDPQIFRLLYLGMCYSGKGLFDAVEAAAIVHRKLAGKPVRFRLVVAGTFWVEAEKIEFERRVRESDLQDGSDPVVDFRGFVSGTKKRDVLYECDALCFPTKMPESFGLVLLEGMAFGLPVITTRWRNIPEMLPENYSGVVDPGSPDQLAAAILRQIDQPVDPRLREHFLRHYTEAEFGRGIRAALAQYSD